MFLCGETLYLKTFVCSKWGVHNKYIRRKKDEKKKQTDLKEEILAVVWTTMVNHDKFWLQDPLLVTQFNESRNRVQIGRAHV